MAKHGVDVDLYQIKKALKDEGIDPRSKYARANKKTAHSAYSIVSKMVEARIMDYEGVWRYDILEKYVADCIFNLTKGIHEGLYILQEKDVPLTSKEIISTFNKREMEAYAIFSSHMSDDVIVSLMRRKGKWGYKKYGWGKIMAERMLKRYQEHGDVEEAVKIQLKKNWLDFDASWIKKSVWA